MCLAQESGARTNQLEFANPIAAANLPHGGVELLSKYNRAARRGPIRLGLHFQLEPGWHIYWKNPADSGQAPRVHWTSPVGMDAGEIVLPAPDRLTAGPLVDFGYEGDVPQDVPGIVGRPRGDVEWEAVRPARLGARTELPGSLYTQKGASFALSSRPRRRSGSESRRGSVQPHRIQAAGKDAVELALVRRAFRRPNSTELKVSGTSVPAGAMFFPGSAGQAEYGAPRRSEQRAADFLLTLVRPRDAKGPLATLDGILRPPPAPRGGSGQSPDSLLVMTLFAFAGGVLLNLMPCVFPVLSIKVVSLRDGETDLLVAIADSTQAGPRSMEMPGNGRDRAVGAPGRRRMSYGLRGLCPRPAR